MLRKKKILIVVLLLLTVVLVQFAVPQSAEAKTKKVLYTTSSKNITLKPGQSKTVTIVFTKTGDVSIDSTKGMVSKQNWSGAGHGDKIKLNITGLTAGKNTIIIRADGTKQKVKFNVTVKGKDNYYELLKFLYKNVKDEEQDDGSYEKTYSYHFTDDNGLLNYYQISESDDKILVSYVTYDGDALAGVVFNLNKKLKVEIMSISYRDEEDGTQFMVYVPYFDSKNYTVDKRYDFKVDHNTTYLSDDSIIDFANDVLPNYLNLVDIELKSDLGLGLKDIGFKNYVAS